MWGPMIVGCAGVESREATQSSTMSLAAAQLISNAGVVKVKIKNINTVKIKMWQKHKKAKCLSIFTERGQNHSQQ